MESRIKKISQYETLECPEDYHFIDAKDAVVGDSYFNYNFKEWRTRESILDHKWDIKYLYFCRKNTKTISAIKSLNIAYKDKQILNRGQICKIDHIYIQNYATKDDVDILVRFFEPKSQGYGVDKLQNCIFVES